MKVSKPATLKTFQEMVSLEKKRFKDDKYDLDLACMFLSLPATHQPDITDRIIAMGFPSSGMEKVYRNKMTDVQKFFNEYHPNSYKVYNLCSERNYEEGKFHKQAAYPFDDHNCPTLEQLAACCKVHARSIG